jgi:chromosome segregation ATPase
VNYLADVVVGDKVTRTSGRDAVEILDVTSATRAEVRTADGRRWRRQYGKEYGGRATVRPYEEGDERAVEVYRLRTAYEVARSEVATINEKLRAYERSIAQLERTIEEQLEQMGQAIEARDALGRAEADALAALRAAGGEP